MPVARGTRLGPYEILAPIGAGGMGEVFKARDTRIDREVAVKILPEGVAGDADRLARFRREAELAGGLNHPNLLTIHEFGSHEGRSFLVTELLDGLTLREKMGGVALPARRAVEYATQMAEGLAAAHERGVVHRDLKPENIIITRDGRVKILDFGLAKSTSRTEEPAAITTVPTERRSAPTDPGTVLGTVGYMSPEQVRGEAVDARSDIFAVGAILYEMLTGRRAFRGSTSIDTMHAILYEEPQEFTDASGQIRPALERIVRHCLEKDRERRFQSARDLAFDLSSISGISEVMTGPRRRTRRGALAAWSAILILAAVVAGWFFARWNHRSVPRFDRLTFQSRGIASAAFTPDQQSVIFSTRGTSGVEDVFVSSVGNPEMRSLGLHGALVMGVSRKRELALLLKARFLGGFITVGTLSRLPLSGGAPREIAENIEWADWTPDGDDLLVGRSVGGRDRIELPLGNVLYETPGWIGSPRISPDGRTIAFIDHPTSGSDDGGVIVIDRERRKRVLTGVFTSIQGLAWSPDGKEIWFTGAEKGASRELWAVGLTGRRRLIAGSPNALTIFEVSPDGRALVSENNDRIRMFAGTWDQTSDRELSWLDWTILRDIRGADGALLFDESGEGGGKAYGVYMRGLDGAPAVRLGDGIAGAFSPDGRSVLAIHPFPFPAQVFVYATAAGESRKVTHDGMNHTHAAWLRDGKTMVLRASEGSRSSRLYVQATEGGRPRPISPEGVGFSTPFVSPDGRWVTGRDGDGIVTLYSLNGEAYIKLPELTGEDAIAGWSPDSKELIYVRRNENPARVFRIDVTSHRQVLWHKIQLPETLFGILGLRVSPDGKGYAYCFSNSTADLYLIEGGR